MLWFGVIESGITARYLLLPVTFMLGALAVDLAAMAAATSAGARPVVAALGALAGVVVALETWGGVPPQTTRAEAARPTLVLDALAAELQATDLVAGGDELATLAVAGRVDAWLALDGFFRERFVVMRGAQPTGTYTGAPAAFELSPLVARAARDQRRLVIVDVLKDMPGFGSTAPLVPRQLAREGAAGRGDRRSPRRAAAARRAWPPRRRRPALTRPPLTPHPSVLASDLAGGWLLGPPGGTDDATGSRCSSERRPSSASAWRHIRSRSPSRSSRGPRLRRLAPIPT